MDSKVVDLTMNFDYIGQVLKYDLTAILAKSFLKAKQALNTKQGFKFYSTINLWITRRGDEGEEKGGLLKNPVFSGDFQSNQSSAWMESFRDKIWDVLQSGDAIDLKKSVLKFHFVLQPQGSGRSDDRNRDSILNKSSVIRIVNDDNNCFWYALTVSINKDNKTMKDSRYPKKRDNFAKELCKKCKLKWDEPVSFIHIPLIEEALKLNVYVVNLYDIPQLG